PDSAKVKRIANELHDRRNRVRKQGRIAVLDVYERGPNLWLDADPRMAWERRNKNEDCGYARTIREMHEHAFGLMISDGELDWESRRAAFQAIRRAVLRESVLLRLLPSEKERDDSGWGELLVEKFFAPLPQQRESTADKICVFLEDLMAASGSITDPNSARFAFYDATRLRDQQFVALVSGVHGSKDKKTRERVFSGFNTPLLPEVLICTSVGQEGIDLHRHCRHVVHFDLAWNPAVMEQRTGRTDRIGSKTFRERSLTEGLSAYFLEIGVPYLAGTYDERMYEELRLRAQTFEVLTGGDLTADEAEGYDDHKKAEGEEAGLRFVALPDSMVESMRVNLHVWADKPALQDTDRIDAHRDMDRRTRPR
ncbi:MAG: helicase-related protein, partial [Gammaproteobacteria bacterium]|nr:helicase-related protein [Gammaproteobacteria bacterium]